MDNFVNRLGILLETYEFSASAFADKIGVQRSSLSHLLSGRNRPSLDLILKIKECFPELNLDWLIQGKGEISNDKNAVKSTPTSAPPSPTLSDKKNVHEPNHASLGIPTQPSKQEQTLTQEQSIINDSNIEKIIVFYKDGTFKQYSSR